MSKQEIINKLMAKKNELIKLARKRNAILVEKRRKDMEIAKLKRDITNIRTVASKNIFRTIKRGLKSKKTKRAVAKTKVVIKKGKSFLKAIDSVIKKMPD